MFGVTDFEQNAEVTGVEPPLTAEVLERSEEASTPTPAESAPPPVDEALEAFNVAPSPGALPVEEPEEDAAGASPRAERRIKGLITRLKEKDSKLGELGRWARDASNQHSQLQQSYAKQQHANQGLREQLIRLETQFESIQQQRAVQASEDPAEAFKAEVVGDAIQKVRAERDPQIKALSDELDRLKAEREDGLARARHHATKARINAAADDAVRRHLTNGFDDQAARAVHEPIAALVTAWGYGRQLEPEHAAQELLGIFAKWSTGRVLAQRRAKGQKVAQSQKTTPAAPGSSRAPVSSGAKIPTQAEAEKAGFRDPLEAQMAADGLIGT